MVVNCTSPVSYANELSCYVVLSLSTQQRFHSFDLNFVAMQIKIYPCYFEFCLLKKKSCRMPPQLLLAEQADEMKK